MADTITSKKRLALKFPIKVEGVEVQHLDFRRMKGKDIRDMDREPTNLEKAFFMIGRLAEISPEAVDELDAEDFDAASKIVEGFMGRRRSR